MRRAQFCALRFGARAVAALVVYLHAAGRIIVDRPAGFGIEARRPIQLVYIRLTGDERAVGAVESVEETVARCMHHKLAILAINLGINDWVLGDFIEIIGIVWGILEAPFDLAVVGGDCEHARGPFVVAWAIFRVPIGAGIADALVESISFGIVSGCLPNRRSAVLPAFLAVLPGLVTGFAGTRNGVRAPGRLAGVEIGRLDEAANAELATRRADDGKVADDERRDGQCFADRWIGDLALPYDFPGRLVDGEHSTVEGDRDDLVLPQRDTAVVDAAAGDVAGPGAVGA